MAKKKKVKTDEAFDALAEIAGDMDKLSMLDDEEQLFVIPSVLPSFNRATYIGGIPGGSIIEFYGPSKGGKTTLGIACLIAAQRAGHIVGILDSEGSFKDKNWPRDLGLDLNRTIYHIPETYEEGADFVNNSIKKLKEKRKKDKRFKDVCMLWLIDSVSAMVPAEELEGNIKARQFPLQAGLNSTWCRILNHHVIGTNIGVIFINQERDVMGAVGNQERTKSTGGQAIKFIAHFRVKVSRSMRNNKTFGGEKICTGYKHEGVVKKTKFAPDDAKFTFYTSNGIYYPSGWDTVNTNYDEAVVRGIIKKGTKVKCDYNEETKVGLSTIMFSKNYKEDVDFQAWLEQQLAKPLKFENWVSGLEEEVEKTEEKNND